jgi:hypothetical protein
MIGGNVTNNDDKWNSGLDLFIESVYKPDNELRQLAHDQKCFNELMGIRWQVLEYLQTLRKH